MKKLLKIVSVHCPMKWEVIHKHCLTFILVTSVNFSLVSKASEKVAESQMPTTLSQNVKMKINSVMDFIKDPPLELDRQTILYQGDHAILLTTLRYFSGQSTVLNAVLRRLPLFSFARTQYAAMTFAESFDSIQQAEQALNRGIEEYKNSKNIFHFGPDFIKNFKMHEQVTFTRMGSRTKGLGLNFRTMGVSATDTDATEFRIVIERTGKDQATAWITYEVSDSDAVNAGLGLATGKIDAERSFKEVRDWWSYLPSIYSSSKSNTKVMGNTLKITMDFEAMKGFYEKVIAPADKDSKRKQNSAEDFNGVAEYNSINVIESLYQDLKTQQSLENSERKGLLALLQKDIVNEGSISGGLSTGYIWRRSAKKRFTRQHFELKKWDEKANDWVQSKLFIHDSLNIFKRDQTLLGILGNTGLERSVSVLYEGEKKDMSNSDSVDSDSSGLYKNFDLEKNRLPDDIAVKKMIAMTLTSNRYIHGNSDRSEDVENLKNYFSNLQIPKDQLSILFPEEDWTQEKFSTFRNVEVESRYTFSRSYIELVAKQIKDFIKIQQKVRIGDSGEVHVDEIKSSTAKYLEDRLRDYARRQLANGNFQYNEGWISKIKSWFDSSDKKSAEDRLAENTEIGKQIKGVAGLLAEVVNLEAAAQDRADAFNQLRKYSLMESIGGTFFIDLVEDKSKLVDVVQTEITSKYEINTRDGVQMRQRKAIFGLKLDKDIEKIFRALKRAAGENVYPEKSKKSNSLDKSRSCNQLFAS